MTLIFATNNQHKVEEIQSVLPKEISILTLKQAGIDIDIPEPYDTLEDNAKIKAETIFQLTNTNCFSEDTGLEVPALNNEPGVKSARYAGDEKCFQKNIEKLFFNLKDKKNRVARFRTVICLILDGKKHFFEGISEGQIISEKRGEAGFGYDPVFMPAGSSKTFAEMTLAEKNCFSHRSKAVAELLKFLNNII